MADDSEQFCSDRATGNLTDYFSSRDDFPPIDEFLSTPNECNSGGEDVGEPSQVQSNWVEYDQRCPDDEKKLDEKEEARRKTFDSYLYLQFLCAIVTRSIVLQVPIAINSRVKSRSFGSRFLHNLVLIVCWFSNLIDLWN